jgi:hypothetical protein
MNSYLVIYDENHHTTSVSSAQGIVNRAEPEIDRRNRYLVG